MNIKTKVYLCRLGTEYHVLKAGYYAQANRRAIEKGGYVIREAYANERLMPTYGKKIRMK
jgi:hypothetical protein